MATLNNREEMRDFIQNLTATHDETAYKNTIGENLAFSLLFRKDVAITQSQSPDGATIDFSDDGSGQPVDYIEFTENIDSSGSETTLTIQGVGTGEIKYLKIITQIDAIPTYRNRRLSFSNATDKTFYSQNRNFAKELLYLVYNKDGSILLFELLNETQFDEPQSVGGEVAPAVFLGNIRGVFSITSGVSNNEFPDELQPTVLDGTPLKVFVDLQLNQDGTAATGTFRWEWADTEQRYEEAFVRITASSATKFTKSTNNIVVVTLSSSSGTMIIERSEGFVNIQCTIAAAQTWTITSIGGLTQENLILAGINDGVTGANYGGYARYSDSSEAAFQWDKASSEIRVFNNDASETRTVSARFTTVESAS